MYNIPIIDSIKTGPSIKNEFEKGLSIYQYFPKSKLLTIAYRRLYSPTSQSFFIQYLLFL